MNIKIKTKVEQDYLSVKEGFNESLFKKLSPPFPPVKLIRFDGSHKGDLVALELNFLLFRQKWISEITEDQTDSEEFYFIDKGIELPFFLKSWTHKHRVIRKENASIIQDEISFEGPFFLLTLLLYPAMLLQFGYRIPIYKKIFKKRN
jgi:ligand-binding SRPBCC domain-containing protein